jgi:segregation and condensation protein B
LLFSEDTKAIIESLLFISSEPLSILELSQLVNIEPRDIEQIVLEIREEYEKATHGFHLVELAGGYIFATKEQYNPYIEKLLKPQLSTLSHAALETLAIVAYKQPVTRSEIEAIRGVKVDKIISTLVEKNLIEEVGRKEGPGRPIIYATTKEFLKYFGLKDLSQLPEYENLLEGISNINTKKQEI